MGMLSRYAIALKWCLPCLSSVHAPTRSPRNPSLRPIRRFFARKKKKLEKTPFFVDIFIDKCSGIPPETPFAAVTLRRAPRASQSNLAANEGSVCTFQQTLGLSVTLYLDPSSKSFEDKEYEVVIFGFADPKTKPKEMASATLDLAEFADPGAEKLSDPQYLDLAFPSGARGQVKVVLRATPASLASGGPRDDAQLRKISKLKRMSMAMLGVSETTGPKLGRRSLGKEAEERLKRDSAKDRAAGVYRISASRRLEGVQNMEELVYGDKGNTTQVRAESSRRSLARMSAQLGDTPTGLSRPGEAAHQIHAPSATEQEERAQRREARLARLSAVPNAVA